MNTPSWLSTWRKGFAPLLNTHALTVLRDALQRDDPRLLQGQTTTPPPLQCVADWPVEAACLIGYCGWQAEGLQTVAEVEQYFGEVCKRADELIGEPSGCRWLLNAWDETPRDEIRQALLAELNRELELRSAAA